MSRDGILQRLRAGRAHERIITALDVPTADAAVGLARQLVPQGRYVKVGLELFTAAGPGVVARLQELGLQIFLDLKYHDIPNTVAGAIRVASRLGAAMVTIHAAAGRRAMSSASETLAREADLTEGWRPALLAVTILTSLGETDLAEIAPAAGPVPQCIVRLARLAWNSGCDGIVCAAPDLPLLRQELGPHPLVVTPGIRPAAADMDDQRRTATPAAAMAAGADFLVIGRPITRAAFPGEALAEIGRGLPA